MAAIQPGIPNPLAEMADIHLPQAVAIWPPAPGWWIVALLIILCGYFLQRLIRSYLKTHHYRKALLLELQQISRQWHKQNNVILTAAKLSALLRRYFMDQDERQSVASLSSKPWCSYLNKHIQVKLSCQELLLELPYQDPLIKLDMEDNERYTKEINNLINILNKLFKESKRPRRI